MYKFKWLRVFIVAFIIGAMVLPSLPVTHVSIPSPNISLPKIDIPWSVAENQIETIREWTNSRLSDASEFIAENFSLGPQPVQADSVNLYAVVGQATATSGSATVTGSPARYTTAGGTITVTTSTNNQTFTMTTAAGTTATVTSGTATISGSPKACAAGTATTVTVSNTITNGTCTIAVTYASTGLWSSQYSWATVSGGTPGGHAIPGSTNNVYFDANTFTAVGQSFTNDVASQACADMVWTNAANTPTWAGSTTLSIYGSFTGNAAMTHSYTGTITWASTGAGKTITSGASIQWSNSMVFNGVGGGWQLQDTLQMSSASYTLTMTNGTLDTNGQSVITGNFLTVSGSSTLTLGATIWQGFGNWTANNLTNLNANTSSLRFLSAATQFTGGGKNYNDVQFNGSGAAAVLDLNTFATLTRTGTAVTTDTLVFSANETITGTLTLTGNSIANRLACKSNTTSTRTLTSAANVVTNSDFYYINGAGAASWNFSANPGGAADMGGNQNLTLTSTVYWVGNTGNWVSGAGSHWSGTSGGSPHGDFLPITTVSARFDVNSFSTAGQIITLDSTGNCLNFDWTGALNAPQFKNGGASLNVYGNYILVPGMSTSASGGGSYYTYLLGTGGPYTINTNGVTLSSAGNGLYINGSGGTWNLAGNLTIARSDGFWGFQIANGTFNTNDYSLSLTGTGGVFTTQSGTSTINLGSSSLSVHGWNVAGGTVTLNAGTSAMTVTSTTFTGGGYAYYNVIFNGAGTVAVAGANTFNNLSRIGTAALTDSISFSADQIVNGTFSVTSNSGTNRVLVQSSSQGTLRTISAGSVAATNADWSDISGAGNSAWNVSAGNNGDAGGNIGITFTTPANIYWFGNTGSWTDATHWYWGSGGTGGNARVPLIQDTAVFDANSFVVPGTLTLSANYRFSSINTSTVSNTPVFSATGATFYGGNLNITGTIWSVTTAYIYGRNLTTLTTGGVSLQALTIGQGTTNGTLTLNDNPTCTGAITLLAGALNLNGHTLTAANVDVSTTTYVRSLTMGTGNIVLNCTTAINKWNAAATNFNFYCGTGTIIFTSSLNNAQSMTLGGLTYYNVIIAGAGTYTMTLNSAFSCYVFAIDRSQAAKTLTGSYTITQTALSIPVSGVTTVTLTNTRFSMAAGVFSTDYMTISGSTANGGATFYAGSHSSNGGSNSGWIWSDPAGPFPTATTNSVTGLTIGGATLNGALTNIGSYTPVYGYFQYDQTGTYISPISTTLQSLTVNGAFTQAITGLNFNNTYHFRAVVIYNTATYSYGTDTTFTTLGAPTVATGNAVNITDSTATIQGNLISLVSYTSGSVYFDYGLTVSYGYSSPYQAMTNAGAFSYGLTGLSASQTYHFRANVLYGNGLTVLGTDNTFSTSSLLTPSVTTNTITNLTATSVTVMGTISSLGNYTAVYIYFDYGLTMSYGNTPVYQAFKVTGTFSENISGLTPSTLYHYRASVYYANGSIVNASDATFNTLNINAASISALAPTGVANNGMTMQGSLTSIGNVTVTIEGFVWSTSTHGSPGNVAPTSSGYSGYYTKAGSFSVGTFSYIVSSLNANTTYYIRAFAYNASGWVYSNEITQITSNATPIPTAYFAIYTGPITASTSTPSAYAPINMGSSAMPSQFYTEGDTSGIPGASAIHAIFGYSSTPDALWWFPFMYGIIAILSLLFYELTTSKGTVEGSLLSQFIVIEAMLVFFGVLGTAGVSGLIPLYGAFLFPIPAVAIIMSKKHYGWG